MRQLPRSFSFATLGAVLFFCAASAYAEDSSLNVIPGLQDKAVVIDIVARVVERNQQEVWNSENSKVTIPGRPVSLKLVGQNVVVLVQFTPYRRDDGRQVLVAQGQVWVNTGTEGIRYQTTMQTIPLDFGERIYFFPLGPQTKDGHAQIEIQVELHPYKKAEDKASGAPSSPGDVKNSPGDVKKGDTKQDPKTDQKSTGDNQATHDAPSQ